MPLIPALEKHRQVGLCEFKANLACIVSSMPAGIIGDPVSKNTKKGKKGGGGMSL